MKLLNHAPLSAASVKRNPNYYMPLCPPTATSFSLGLILLQKTKQNKKQKKSSWKIFKPQRRNYLSML